MGDRRIIFIALVLLSAFLFRGVAKADPPALTGILDIEIHINSNNDKVTAIHYDDSLGAVDDFDNFDTSWLNPPSGWPGIYSDITTHKLKEDYRSISSTLDFNVKLVYNGILASDTPNHIQFSLPYGAEWEFGDKEILFQSDLLPYGTVVDVRRAIAENGGRVDLIDLPAGTYNSNTPYGEGILTVGTRILSDLVDETETVNFKDFSELAKDWKKPQGKYPGDITGANGIPDGYVDEKDLGAFSGQWLKTL